MKQVQTTEEGNEDQEPAQMSNGLQLISLICTAINTLGLSRNQVKQWTNNLGRLRAWVRLLATDWMPTKTTAVQKTDRQSICTLSEVCEGKKFNSKGSLESAAPWIESWNSKGSPISDAKNAYHLTEKEREWRHSEPRLASTSAFRCDIVEELNWYVCFFRSVFAFEGKDEILIRAFHVRNVVWTVDSVLSLLAVVIHDPEDDPFDLGGLQGTAWFPVYTGPISNSGRFDINLARENIIFMSVNRSSDMHLGKRKWRYRIFHTLGDILDGKHGIGDHVIKAGDTIFFKNSPLPREKKPGYQEWNPALHSK